MLQSISNIWLLVNIEIITENKTTNPPIITTVEIALLILLDKTSPKLFILTICLEDCIGERDFPPVKIYL